MINLNKNCKITRREKMTEQLVVIAYAPAVESIKKISQSIEWLSPNVFTVPITWEKNCPANTLVRDWIRANPLDDGDGFFVEATPFQYFACIDGEQATLNIDRSCFDGQGSEIVSKVQCIKMAIAADAEVQRRMNVNPYD
jgi:hypothetical protein